MTSQGPTKRAHKKDTKAVETLPWQQKGPQKGHNGCRDTALAVSIDEIKGCPVSGLTPRQ